MRVSISTRLFFMCLLAMAVAAALGLGLLRLRFSGAGAGIARADAEAIDALGRDLSKRFDAHGDWRFMPAEPDARTAWLRARVAQATPQGAALSSLAGRVALADISGRRIAGDAPGPLLVAIASIDRRQWTIPSRRGVAGYLSVALPRDADDALTIAFLIQKQHELAVLAAISALLAALVAAVVATRLRQPLRALVAGSRRLAQGNFDARIDAHRGDEFGELAQAFNELGARLAAAARSRRQWIADTSHELRTPLAVLQAQVEAMQDGIRPLTPAGLQPMGEQVAALRRLVDDLDQLARGDVGTRVIERQRTELWSVVESTWRAFDDRLRERGLSRRLTPPESAAMGLADASRLAQVFGNLLENSARYTAPGGCVALTGIVDGAHLRVDLDDTAPGIPADALSRLGERFYRVDASRSREHGGSGLGLALARQIVEAHGGELRFEPSPLGGLRVRVTLPLADA